MTPRLQRTSQDLSWQRSEPSIILPRALQVTESEHRAQPHQCQGAWGEGMTLWGLTCQHCGPSWLLSLFCHDSKLGEWTKSSQFASG